MSTPEVRPAGVWFKPFVAYREVPPVAEKRGASKTFHFYTPSFRFWYAHLYWDQRTMEIEKEGKSTLRKNIVVLPDRDIVLSAAKLSDLQEEVEGRLMILTVWSTEVEEDEWNHPPPYEISLRTPSESIYKSRLGRSTDWLLEDAGETYVHDFVYLLESPLVMENTEMKIEHM